MRALTLGLISAFVCLAGAGGAYAQGDGVAGSEALSALTARYQASSELVRPGLARQISRQLRNAQGIEPSVSARAHIALSQQAAVDYRKDRALETARTSVSLAQQSNDKVLQAKAAIALTRAHILQQSYVAALETIATARLAYGPSVDEGDATWDELVMYEGIAEAAFPSYLRSEIRRVGLSASQRLTLTGERGVRCGQADSGIVRLDNVGLNPFAGALSSMIDSARGGVTNSLLSADNGLRNTLPVTAPTTRTTAGIAVRADLGPDGKVIRSVVTAYAPSESFAAAASVAAPTWQFQIPANLPPSCRNNILTVLAIQAR
jgi:hypothetical protein